MLNETKPSRPRQRLRPNSWDQDPDPNFCLETDWDGNFLSRRSKSRPKCWRWDRVQTFDLEIKPPRHPDRDWDQTFGVPVGVFQIARTSSSSCPYSFHRSAGVQSRLPTRLFHQSFSLANASRPPRTLAVVCRCLHRLSNSFSLFVLSLPKLPLCSGKNRLVDPYELSKMPSKCEAIRWQMYS